MTKPVYLPQVLVTSNQSLDYNVLQKASVTGVDNELAKFEIILLPAYN